MASEGVLQINEERFLIHENCYSTGGFRRGKDGTRELYAWLSPKLGIKADGERRAKKQQSRVLEKKSKGNHPFRPR